MGRAEYLLTSPLYTRYSLLKANQVYYLSLLRYIYISKHYITDNVSDTSLYSFHRQELKVPKTRTKYARQYLEYRIPLLLNMVGMQGDLEKKI